MPRVRSNSCLQVRDICSSSFSPLRDPPREPFFIFLAVLFHLLEEAPLYDRERDFFFLRWVAPLSVSFLLVVTPETFIRPSISSSRKFVTVSIGKSFFLR